MPLRALIVEDRAADADLILRELKRGGFVTTHQRVETAEALRDFNEGHARGKLVIKVTSDE